MIGGMILIALFIVMVFSFWLLKINMVPYRQIFLREKQITSFAVLAKLITKSTNKVNVNYTT